MKQIYGCCFTIFFLMLSVCTVQADSIAEAQFDIHQMWALSKNYYYGTTVPKDKMMALAWQMVYISVLPNSYPGVSELLEIEKHNLSDSEITLAKNKALELKAKYHLDFQLSERELFQSYHSTPSSNDTVATNKVFSNLDEFLDEVKQQNPALEKRYRDKIKQQRHKDSSQPMIYGQVVVNGPPPSQAVSVNIPLDIDEAGYFLAFGLKGPLTFQLSGYEKKSRAFSSTAKEVNLARISLTPLEDEQKASIVGAVKPAKAIKDLDIVLKLKEQAERSEPWFNTLESITILSNGQFYANGLSPTDYELIISYRDKTYKQDINLHPGMVKTLHTTDLSG